MTFLEVIEDLEKKAHIAESANEHGDFLDRAESLIRIATWGWKEWEPALNRLSENLTDEAAIEAYHRNGIRIIEEYAIHRLREKAQAILAEAERKNRAKEEG